MHAIAFNLAGASLVRNGPKRRVTSMHTLDDRTSQRLLQHARDAIRASLTGDSAWGDAKPWPDLPHAGVFVTLRKHHALRGCIGTFSPECALQDVVAEMAVAATHDPRFVENPISLAELPDIHIELSILSPRVRIHDPLAFESGVHGIYLKNGGRSGCFLPDVGEELGWDKERFLTELCRQKAGLSPNAWRDAATEVFTFTVQKLSET